MTSLPLSKLIVPPAQLIATIFASDGGVLMRRVIVPPSKSIVTRQFPPKGGFLIRGGFLLRGRDYNLVAGGMKRTQTSSPWTGRQKALLYYAILSYTRVD